MTISMRAHEKNSSRWNVNENIERSTGWKHIFDIEIQELRHELRWFLVIRWCALPIIYKGSYESRRHVWYYVIAAYSFYSSLTPSDFRSPKSQKLTFTTINTCQDPKWKSQWTKSINELKFDVINIMRSHTNNNIPIILYYISKLFVVTYTVVIKPANIFLKKNFCSSIRFRNYLLIKTMSINIVYFIITNKKNKKIKTTNIIVSRSLNIHSIHFTALNYSYL